MKNGDGGPPRARQPVHLVAGGAHLFTRGTAAKLGSIALRMHAEHASTPDALAAAFGLADASLAETVWDRVRAKLEREPVEDYRIDFEDGFGARSDEEEDATAIESARETALGVAADTLPPALGIRIKPLSGGTPERALRTLDLYVTRVVEDAGRLPAGFVVTLPKIFDPAEVSALATALEALEARLGLAANAIGIELMIETPRSLIAADGRVATPELVRAARGRCVAAHLGAFDLTAAASITAGNQGLAHPLADFGRQILQLSLAEKGVRLSDGVTTVLPIAPHRAGGDGTLTPAQVAENRTAIHAAWRAHYDDVRRSLAQGFYQSWDLHPGQLVSRYTAVYAFFLDELDDAARRLKAFVDGAAQARLTGAVFDDEATGQGLLNFFLRGLACGALTDQEADRCGLSRSELASRSFSEILAGRSA